MLGGTTQDAALVAWSKVERAVREVGPYPSVGFNNALIHRVLHEMGGWIALSTKTEEHWPFVRNEFVNRYRGYRMRSEMPDYPAVLMGRVEAHNTREGFCPQAPVLIGDPEQATQVMRGGTDKPLLGFTRLDVATVAPLRLAERAA